MQTPANPIEIFLQPGEVYFGDRDTRIRTLLGSCVAVVMWHPGLQVGGMCHYMLPRKSAEKGRVLDGRYADEAMELMMREIRNAGTSPGEYQVKLFGGGHMFAAHQTLSRNHVGARNVEVARLLMKQHGFISCAEHLGGIGHRNIFFDIWSGHVWVRHQPLSKGDNRSGALCRK